MPCFVNDADLRDQAAVVHVLHGNRQTASCIGRRLRSESKYVGIYRVGNRPDELKSPDGGGVKNGRQGLRPIDRVVLMLIVGELRRTTG